MRTRLTACFLPVWALLGQNCARQPDKCENSIEDAFPSASVLQKTRSLLSPRRPLVLTEGANSMLYNHLAKTGGTFVKRVLHAAIPATSLVLQDEGGSLDELRLTTEPFTVGAIRHPCEYYVSLWAHNHYPSLDKEPDLQVYGETPHNDTQNVLRFREFVRWSSPEEIGAMTFRFLFSYAALPPLNESFHFTPARRYFDQLMTSEQRQAALQRLEHFDPSRLDCWIQTEKLEETLRACIGVYEEQGGAVNHSLMEAAIRDSTHNPSEHGSCSQYYDPETEAFVKEKDARIFQLFRFDSCCRA